MITKELQQKYGLKFIGESMHCESEFDEEKISENEIKDKITNLGYKVR